MVREKRIIIKHDDKDISARRHGGGGEREINVQGDKRRNGKQGEMRKKCDRSDRTE